MSSNSSNRVVRTLGVPAMALVLASSSMVALAGTAAAKPMPSLAVVVSCDTKVPNENGNHNTNIKLTVDASYKGKWVAFDWLVGTGQFQKDGSEERFDSKTTYSNESINLLTGATGLTNVDVTVQLKDKKGGPVGDPFMDNVACTLNS